MLGRVLNTPPKSFFDKRNFYTKKQKPILSEEKIISNVYHNLRISEKDQKLQSIWAYAN